MSLHKPVLLKETIELLNLKEGSIVVDATLGGGGHSREILKIIKEGKLIAIDADKSAIDNFKKEADGRVILVNDNFSNLENILVDLEIKKVDAILADLGWSSDQLEGKGMSFQKDEELDMRLSQSQGLTAKKIVNEYSAEDLEKIIEEYGEERWVKRIARKISEARKIKAIETTKELAEIIEKAIPRKFWPKGISPATRTFQALRIEVNQELENLEKFIPEAIEKLAPRGRLAIISFHSLEDRIVKNIYRTNARGRVRIDELTGQKIQEEAPEIKIITKKPIMSGEVETVNNPRARSAKLRVAEKV
jgi:16S rRNA (cytosine1402-N4)-methyltransferase